MKPTLIKRCTSDLNPNDPTGQEVLLDYHSDSPKTLYPEYCLVYEDDYYWIGIKPKFASDGGSIPRLLWTLIGLTPQDPRCRIAWFLHDGLYRSHLLPQAIADKIMLNVMSIEPRANWVQRQVVYWTLRAVGFKSYNDKSESDINTAKEFVTVKIK